MFRQLGWRLLALVFVGLGLIGVVVPGMPTTVFMLLATWAGGHGWPALNHWILNHPRFGPPVQQWRRHRAVPRQAKWLAAVSMVLSMGIICISSTPIWLKWALPTLMCVVLLWLCTRPETRPCAEAPSK